jgi:hypothetical protein
MHRLRHSGRGLVVLIATVAAALAGIQSAPAASKPLAKPAPLRGLQEGPTVSRTVACTKTVTVLIAVYQFFSQPTANGCWGYNRPYQNAGQGNGTWKICYRDGSVQGTGPNRIYDDTSPGMTLSGETSRINNCGNLYGEYLAKRPQNGENWCTNRGYPSSCWRRNSGTIVSVSRYFAEVFTDDFSVENLFNTWQATGSGASPANSYPIYNIRPHVFNNTGSSLVLYNDVVTWCNRAGNGGYYSIYAGASGGLFNQTVTQGDVNTFSNAMNACTS